MIIRNTAVATVAAILCIACGSGSEGPAPAGGPAPPAYTVGGTVSGLRGSGFKIQNGASHLSIMADGAFTFPDSLQSGASYSVSVENQPATPTQACTVANAGGTIDHANITNIEITCSTPETGRQWQTPSLLQHDDAGIQDSPRIVVNNQGAAALVWRHFPSALQPQVLASRYSPESRTWSDPVRIGPESGTGNFGASGQPRTAIQDNGDIVAVWPQIEQGSFEILASQFTNSRGWSTPARLDQAFGTAGSPSVVFDSGGSSFVAWSQTDSGVYHIYFSRLAPGGTQWSAPVQVDAAVGGAEFPQLAADAHGNVFGAWLQRDSLQAATGLRVWSSIYTSGAWGTPSLVGGDSTSNAFSNLLVSNMSGTAQVMWLQTDRSLWSNRYTPEGGWGTASMVDPPGKSDADPELAIDATGNVLAVWQTSDGHIAYSRSTSGTVWSIPTPVSHADAGTSETAEFPRIAFDGNGNAITVWTRTTDAGTSARSALYTSGGGWGNAMDLGNTGDVLIGLVAVAPDGVGLAAWEQIDGPTSETGIWVTRFE